ncbi:hypothetical protein M0805_009213 [Coniferiporia weirii]|nr:hypothetical protein M0805_009213 [Coniferiporia weirii]
MTTETRIGGCKWAEAALPVANNPSNDRIRSTRKKAYRDGDRWGASCTELGPTPVTAPSVSVTRPTRPDRLAPPLTRDERDPSLVDYGYEVKIGRGDTCRGTAQATNQHVHETAGLVITGCLIADWSGIYKPYASDRQNQEPRRHGEDTMSRQTSSSARPHRTEVITSEKLIVTAGAVEADTGKVTIWSQIHQRMILLRRAQQGSSLMRYEDEGLSLTPTAIEKAVSTLATGTIAAFSGCTIRTYHTEGAGADHAHDIIVVRKLDNVLPPSTIYKQHT